MVIFFAKYVAPPDTNIKAQCCHGLSGGCPEPVLGLLRPQWPAHVLHKIQLDKQRILGEFLFVGLSLRMLPPHSVKVVAAALLKQQTFRIALLR